VEFIAASMTLDMDNTDKLAEFRRDAARLGITVEPPSINRSGANFDVAEGAIRYALAAVKGVGRQAVESLVAARADKPFRDLGDLARRIDPRGVNKRTLEALVSAGALDELEPERARAHAAIDLVMATASRARDEASAGQSQLFGGAEEPFIAPKAEGWTPALRLRKEHEAVGFFLSGHPLDDFASALPRLRVQRWADFAKGVRHAGSSLAFVAAVVTDRSERRTKTGNKMGVVQLSDQSGHFEAVIFSEGLQRLRDLLEAGKVLRLRLSATLDGDEVKARIEDAEPLEPLAAQQVWDIKLHMRDATPLETVARHLKEPGRGKVSIVLSPEDLDGDVEIALPGRYAVSPALIGALKAIPGVEVSP
jgi:DNA polymerase-3 subunit alpha